MWVYSQKVSNWEERVRFTRGSDFIGKRDIELSYESFGKTGWPGILSFCLNNPSVFLSYGTSLNLVIRPNIIDWIYKIARVVVKMACC